MNRAARLFPIGLMLGMAALAFWLNVITMQRDLAPHSIDKKTPEYTLTGLSAKRFDQQGRPLQNMTAAKMWQLPDNPRVYLTKPEVQAFHEGVADYRVQAQTGSYHKQDKIAVLQEQVIWQKPATTTAAAIVMRTSQLQIDTEARSASNRAPISVTQGNSSLTATGFNYKQASSQLELLSNVRIRYAP